MGISVSLTHLVFSLNFRYLTYITEINLKSGVYLFLQNCFHSWRDVTSCRYSATNLHVYPYIALRAVTWRILYRINRCDRPTFLWSYSKDPPPSDSSFEAFGDLFQRIRFNSAKVQAGLQAPTIFGDQAVPPETVKMNEVVVWS